MGTKSRLLATFPRVGRSTPSTIHHSHPPFSRQVHGKEKGTNFKRAICLYSYSLHMSCAQEKKHICRSFKPDHKNRVIARAAGRLPIRRFPLANPWGARYTGHAPLPEAWLVYGTKDSFPYFDWMFGATYSSRPQDVRHLGWECSRSSADIAFIPHMQCTRR